MFDIISPLPTSLVIETSMKTPRLLLALGLLAAITGCATTESKPEHVAVVEAPVSEAPKPKLDSTAALVADGTKLLKEGRATDAKAKFEAALVKDGGSADAKVGLAQADLKLGDFAGAKAILTELQKAQPDSRPVVLLLGLLHKEQGDFKAGISLYEKELEKQKAAGAAPDAEMLNNLITMYRMSKDYDEAIKACTTLLSRDPTNNDALKNLSLVYFDQGKFDLAETIAVNSLKLNDKDAALYNNQGMIRVKKKRYPEAMSFFYKAVSVDPNNMAAHLNIGSIALRYRDYQNAATHFAEAMKLEPKHPDANLGYGLALSGLSGSLSPDEQQKKAPEAIAQLQRALEVDAGATEALGEIAMINKLQMQNLDEAKSWCDKYKAAVPKMDDKDAMKSECAAIDGELKAKAAASRAMEQMKKQQAEEEASKPKEPLPAPAAPAASQDAAPEKLPEESAPAPAAEAAPATPAAP